MPRTNLKFSELSTPAKAGVVGLAASQITLAVLAFVDLARRPNDNVRGPKTAWIPVILVDWIGPITYFVVGRKR